MVSTESKDLTIKQKKFLLKYFEYGNGTQAALEVYRTENPVVAASIAHENLRKLQNHVQTLMEKRGLDLNRLLDVLDEGLKKADYGAKHRYLETAAKWLGIEAEVEAKALVRADQAVVFQVVKGDK
ncbi:MAG: hypothetical protein A2172_05295 [Candidatus Woykebacteria bacterium RBG_13_40_15]|uniref:Terminase small subunit n=1 Tax=Candidatus Woykebacteria bacterium RBG_13_40_15 TaxID=1802593 RepID=A0A1G1W4Z2_9BACT|nr:MAG: hypothetical protein A2172_05295 [Candidatus Woykebacteria bacterium RBG_13_40_15]